MKLWRWLLGKEDLGVIAEWNQERMRQHELANLRAMGRVVDPVYTWSHRFRAAASQPKV